MARHQLLRGRHVLRSLPEPVSRHAVVEHRHGAAGSSPVRRGLAVVAVVGGALSAVGVPTVVLSGGTGDGATAVGLAGLAAGEPDDGAARATDPPAPPSGADAPAVLDTDAVARAVRKAGEEGKRLTAPEPGPSAPAAARPADPDPAPDAARAGVRTARQFPGELIDPNEWYLTLPTGQQGRPDTVDGASLATYHSRFFGLTAARDGIVFSAGAGGVTTKNSHYPRSELREMNGEVKAAWSNRDGTHVLDVREAFTKLPGAKPEVVGVQIHDDKDDVLQIRLEGTVLSVQYDDGRSQVVLDPDYRLGAVFDVRIVAANSKVQVFYDGAKKADLPLAGSGWYWKVGAYVQSNASKGDAAGSTGEVVVYRADVTHS